MEQEQINELTQEKLEKLEIAIEDLKTKVTSLTPEEINKNIFDGFTGENLDENEPEIKITSTPSNDFKKMFLQPIGTEIPFGPDGDFGFFKVNMMGGMVIVEWYYNMLVNGPEIFGPNAFINILGTRIYPEFDVVYRLAGYGADWYTKYIPGSASGLTSYGTGLPTLLFECNERKVNGRVKSALAADDLRSKYGI